MTLATVYVIRTRFGEYHRDSVRHPDRYDRITTADRAWACEYDTRESAERARVQFFGGQAEVIETAGVTDYSLPITR